MNSGCEREVTAIKFHPISIVSSPTYFLITFEISSVTINTLLNDINNHRLHKSNPYGRLFEQRKIQPFVITFVYNCRINCIIET